MSRSLRETDLRSNKFSLDFTSEMYVIINDE